MTMIVDVGPKTAGMFLVGSLLVVVALVDPSLYDPVIGFLENVLAGIQGAY
jgi:hypothetical protein